MVGGWWRLTVDDWWWVAVDGWRLAVGGGGRRAAGGGLAVGCSEGLSLRAIFDKNKKAFLRTALRATHCAGTLHGERHGAARDGLSTRPSVPQALCCEAGSDAQGRGNSDRRAHSAGTRRRQRSTTGDGRTHLRGHPDKCRNIWQMGL